ncbi:ATP-dependent nuclease [Domibacillus enclensis]|uniref:ATP-dependent endonuclease n=1 Tax=Domibacillus enclensis TaxID=1017273 RepID=A0A1N7ATV5_9BACI|nr:AAA family ATPase [Domibacillus enclensis]OXS75078.1 ATP-dependent endonuclease [Domibacillus enclensis]SIR42418.1 Predicted ATP-dependent endonuclease of the OLD family, contains P-loop ATPase and TOPRIM domains [Domibacillus enclensis]
MYISNININNYKNFRNNSIDFNNGINVIIGHNNAGKSNLLRALALIFNSNSKKHLSIDDFNKNIPIEELKEHPPSIKITATLKQDGCEKLMSDDLVTVSNWLSKLEEPYEAKLQYTFYLPTKFHELYKSAIDKAKDIFEVWQTIQDEFLRLYSYKIWGGDPTNQITADSESLNKFDFQFLDAIRDVERDMFSGKNTLLKNVLDFFMDYNIKSDGSLAKEEKEATIKEKKKEFGDLAGNLIALLNQRMTEGKKHILSYANDIGASFDKSTPNFDGSITDIELYSALKLIVEYETGIKMPIINNGLGYNNLIFMSLLLSKMQVDGNEEYLGSNAKVYPMLIIEEPEAHLHPTMQRQLLNFLKRNLSDKKVRQIFVTTHSTHITGAVNLDELICIYKNGNETLIGYPGKSFGENEESKKYIQRFLDATKSNMLFAEKIILVEGLAEQLLMSLFAEYLNISLEDRHIAVINVGGKYFDHFLNLFNSSNPYSIKRKVACITDRDPERKELLTKGKDSSNKKSFKKCYPFEMNISEIEYTYKKSESPNSYSENIQFFLQDEIYGKTLEYDLIRFNPNFKGLVTDSTANRDEIFKLMDQYSNDESLDTMLKTLKKSEENGRIEQALRDERSTWKDQDKKKALVAARYLNSVGKGVNALELAYELEKNLFKKRIADEKESTGFQEFIVPDYIKAAIDWMCAE